MKIKKFLKYATFICSIFVLLFINNNVSAASESFYSRTVRDGDGNVRFKWSLMGKSAVNATKIMKWSNSEPVYCIQPGLDYLDFSDGSYNYTDNQDSVISLSQLTTDVIRKLKLLSYYGYGYGNHTDDSWYLSTQLEIWNTISPDCCYITSGDSALIDSQRKEIRDLVNSVVTVPSFQNRVFTQVINEEVEYVDTNNVLSNYSVDSCTNCTAKISGNKLLVTATSIGTSKVNLKRTITNVYSPSVIFYNGNYQMLMEFGSPDPMLANMTLNVVGGKIQITKVDADTDSTNPSGQASLVGAKYEVMDSNNKVVATLTIGSDNTAITGNLPTGTYTIKEVQAPTGYYLNETIYKATIESGDTVNVIVEDNIIKNYISILKQYDYVNGNTTFLNAESDITFEIYSTDGTLYDKITTDKNGYASINIPYGVWKFHQVNSNTGFEKIYDFYITVDENSEKEQYYNILNNKISAYLQIVKKDSETGKTIELADTTFKILNTDTNQYVSQYVGGKVYDTFKTDDKGVSTTYLKLEAGNYRIEELKSPSGYLLSNDGVEFSIGEDTEYNYTTYGAFVVVDFNNVAIKGQVEIFKSGEEFVIEDGTFKYDTTKLDGVKFNLYADEDIKSADGNYLYYNKGDLIETLITDNNGYAISKQLPLGKYFLVEVETKDNYVLDTNEYHFELTTEDNKTAIIYEKYETLNYLEKGELLFTKTGTNGELIPNTLIEIYTEDNELIFSGKTDENGQISLKNIPVGKSFYLIEKESAEGYLLKSEKEYFMIENDNQVIEINMVNEKIKSILKIIKLDEENNLLSGIKFGIYDLEDNLIVEKITGEDGLIEIELEYGKYYFKELSTLENLVLKEDKTFFEVKEDGAIIENTIVNEFIEGIFELTKTDFATGDVVPNALIEIYNELGELVFSGKTDDNGLIVVKGLKYGKYSYLEKEAPEGYILNNETHYFEIKENNIIVKDTLTNEKVIVEVPDTLNNDYTTITMILLIGIGVGLVLYGSHKKRKKD